MMIILAGVGSFISFYCLIASLTWKRKSRWKHVRLHHRNRRKGTPYGLLYTLLWIPKNEAVRGDYKQLLLGCGLKFETTSYLLLKRVMMIACIILSILIYFLITNLTVSHPIYLIALFMISSMCFVVCLFDKNLLHLIRKKRSERIVQEVYLLSNQLLYYCGSRMNLHSKLKRSIPYTRAIRNDMYRLTTEWYEDADLAIDRFKHRLGTDEGFSFAETLHALKSNDSELYYDLLRQRIIDYKEKIELNKESKRETTSYVLFVLAGIPILNTFRVFVYPWVQEGQKLFESLN